jgi:hypothetical protein
MGENSRMTLLDLIGYLRDQLLLRLDKEGNEDMKGLNELASALLEISLAAEHHGDGVLCNLVDDMIYVIQETSMGARAKGESALPDIEEGIKRMAAD